MGTVDPDLQPHARHARRSPGAVCRVGRHPVGVGARWLREPNGHRRSAKGQWTPRQCLVWWTDRFETMVRMAWLHLGDWTGIETYFDCARDEIGSGCTPIPAVRVIRHRTSPRTFITGSALYHLHAGRTVRPFVGAGIGTIRDREQVTCEPAGCEAPLAGFVGTRVEGTPTSSASSACQRRSDATAYSASSLTFIAPLAKTSRYWKGPSALGTGFDRVITARCEWPCTCCAGAGRPGRGFSRAADPAEQVGLEELQDRHVVDLPRRAGWVDDAQEM